MAVDPVYFRLENALGAVWVDDNILNENQRRLIRLCLAADNEELIEDDVGVNVVPASEDQLETLQRVLAACDEIQRVARADAGWLNADGAEFPTALRRYIHATASHLHRNPHILDDRFFQPLLHHVISDRSHIATLNYDELLYRKFVGTQAMQGFNCLIDGFVGVFDDANLLRRAPARQSFYMHLHGSPMYITQCDNSIRKLHVGRVGEYAGTASSHIVLTHFKYKSAVIASSPVLRSYWKRLQEALNEVQMVTLFGYSGCDVHLNDLINLSQAPRIRIVEWRGDKSQRDQDEFWSMKFPTKDIEVHLLDNILNFVDW